MFVCGVLYIGKAGIYKLVGVVGLITIRQNMQTPRRVRVYDATIVVAVTFFLIAASALVVGLLKPGHSHVAPTPAPTPAPTRNLLSAVPADQSRSKLDTEMRNRGYTHLAVRSNAQFTGVAKSLFPFAKKAAITDVYANTDGEAHWLVVASANGMATTSDWHSAVVVKDSTGAYAVSRNHDDLHNEIRQAVSTPSQ